LLKFIKNNIKIMTKTLLIASSNPGKLREFEAILNVAPVRLLMPWHIGLDLEVVEDGQTYAENAAKKALAYARASQMTALADDSGLEVDALGGAPGLRSARYAGIEGASDADRRRLLLENLAPFPRPWTARFRCTVAVATPEGELFYGEGICPGEISPEERGSGGFGYDPVFFIHEFSKTMAELPAEVKNRISHRGRAAAAVLPFLQQALESASGDTRQGEDPGSQSV
jgi:XTP/dITP diphosphohydrolase